MAAKGIWKVNRSQRLLIPRTLRVPLFLTGNLLQEQNASKVNKIDVSSSPTSWEILFFWCLISLSLINLSLISSVQNLGGFPRIIRIISCKANKLISSSVVTDCHTFIRFLQFLFFCFVDISNMLNWMIKLIVDQVHANRSFILLIRLNRRVHK